MLTLIFYLPYEYKDSYYLIFENSAQEVFLNALKSSVIQLRIRPSNQRPIPPSSPGGTTPLRAEVVADGTDNGTNVASDRTGLASDGKLENSDNAKTEQTAVPVKSPAASARNPTTIPSTKSKFAPIASTRIIGQILKISLKKGKYLYKSNSILESSVYVRR